MANIYSPCALNAKRTLWEELSNVKAASQEPIWCCCGDFNVVRSRSERKERYLVLIASLNPCHC